MQHTEGDTVALPQWLKDERTWRDTSAILDSLTPNQQRVALAYLCGRDTEQFRAVIAYARRYGAKGD